MSSFLGRLHSWVLRDLGQASLTSLTYKTVDKSYGKLISPFKRSISWVQLVSVADFVCRTSGSVSSVMAQGGVPLCTAGVGPGKPRDCWTGRRGYGTGTPFGCGGGVVVAVGRCHRPRTASPRPSLSRPVSSPPPPSPSRRPSLPRCPTVLPPPARGVGVLCCTVTYRAMLYCSWLCFHGWRNREGPSPPGPINSISCVGPGGTQYITKWALFTSLVLFFSNCSSCIGGFGPFETLGDPFPRGPPRSSPPHLSNHLSSPVCFAVSCCAVMCPAVLCCAVLCFAVSCCAVLRRAVLC